MDKSLIINFMLDNLSLLISMVSALIFLIVNIILAIRNHDKSKLKQALLYLPEVISNIETLSRKQPLNSLEKKAMAEVLLSQRFGRLYKKNYQLFDVAIEDILNTPQKKGGSSDVSKENEKR